MPARPMGGPGPVVFVLSAGGNLGAIQVGQLRAVLDAGLRPDAVVGASVGALNATWIAADPTVQAVDRLAALWMSLTGREIFESSRWQQVWRLLRGEPSLHSGAALRAFLEANTPVRDLSHCAVPVHVAVTELIGGRSDFLTDGDTVTALAASTAIPGVLAPVDIDGTLYVDGGVTQSTPLARAGELGASHVVVFDVGMPAAVRTPRSAIETVIVAFAAARRRLVSLDLAAFAPDTQVTWLAPPGSDEGTATLRDGTRVCDIPLTDFSRTGELIELGHRTASAQLRSTSSRHHGGLALLARRLRHPVRHHEHT